jgi:hypothetical protein
MGHTREWLSRWLLVAALSSSCEPAPVDGKGCPCALPYTCCETENVCLAPGEICVDAGRWPIVTTPTSPVPMDRFTVFAASQVDLNVADPQVDLLKPDMVIRAWQQWAQFGTRTDDYQPGLPYLARCQENGIAFMGGVATSVVFQTQFTAHDDSFMRFATRDANGDIVEHHDLSPGMFRATLANPDFRDYLLGIGKIQIDDGVDGLSFDEVNETYQGLTFTGNEGFDDYNLADFNAFLLNKYPGRDFRKVYDMPAGNYLRPDLPAGDLVHNFNYQKYLVERGMAPNPFMGQILPAARTNIAGNPLADEWRGTYTDRPAFGATSFVDQAVPYRYWKDIVDKLRAYARDSQGKEIFITAKGIYPFVDFQSVGLNDFNFDGINGETLHFLPLDDDGHLQGSVSLQASFLRVKELSTAFAPAAPVVVYLDGVWAPYDALSVSERQDYWRLYAAEAYANGVFYAFRLKTASAPSDFPQTATQGGVMDLMTALAAFYRTNADLYHGVTPSPAAAAVTTSAPAGSVMIAVSDQLQPRRRIVHLVNHQYEAGIVAQPGVVVTIPVPGAATSVSVVSPDATEAVPFTWSAGDEHVAVTLESLIAYDVIVVAY